MNPNAPHVTSLSHMFLSLMRNRSLIVSMCKREIAAQYRGSVIGNFWAFVTPLFMLSIYVLIFGVVFEPRWANTAGDSKISFAIILFVGLMLYDFFVSCIQKSTSLISVNVNFVKKVIFPLEVLPWVILGSALFDFCVKFIVLVVAIIFITHEINWTIVYFPLVLLPLVLSTIGLSWFISATGVFIRDVGHTVNVLTFAMIFVSGVFFPLSSIPAEFQPYARCNIVAFLIEESRKVLIFGEIPDWFGLSIALVASVLIAWFGFWWFQKLRKGFSDVL